MTLASGLGSQWGSRRRRPSARPVTVDKFYEFDSAGLALDQNYNDGVGLKANRMFQPSGRMLQTTRSAGGDVPMQVPTKLFGTILDLMHGRRHAGAAGRHAAYLQTHNVGTSQPNKSATMQVNKPDLGGNRPRVHLPGLGADLGHVLV
jgi:hypothetical protein